MELFQHQPVSTLELSGLQDCDTGEKGLELGKRLFGEGI